MPLSIDEILAAADFPTQDVPLCLKASLRREYEDAVEAFDRLSEEIDATKDPAGKVQATQGKLRERREAGERVKALELAMTEYTVVFRLAGRSFSDYNALVVKHPPREGNVVDRAMGFDSSTFHVANVRASIVTPELSDAQWERLVATITDAQFDQLAGAAFTLNRRAGDVSVPFSWTGSEETDDSDET